MHFNNFAYHACFISTLANSGNVITFDKMNETSDMHKMTSSKVRLSMLQFKRVPSLIVCCG